MNSHLGDKMYDKQYDFILKIVKTVDICKANVFW